MTIAVLPPKDAFTRIASSLCVPDPGQDAERTVAFVCQVIRRAALAVMPRNAKRDLLGRGIGGADHALRECWAIRCGSLGVGRPAAAW